MLPPTFTAIHSQVLVRQFGKKMKWRLLKLDAPPYGPVKYATAINKQAGTKPRARSSSKLIIDCLQQLFLSGSSADQPDRAPRGCKWAIQAIFQFLKKRSPVSPLTASGMFCP